METLSDVIFDELAQPEPMPVASTSSETDESYEFYKPNMGTPERFKSSEIILEETDSIESLVVEEEHETSSEGSSEGKNCFQKRINKLLVERRLLIRLSRYITEQLVIN